MKEKTYNFFSNNTIRRLYIFIFIINIVSVITIFSQKSLWNIFWIIVSSVFSMFSYLNLRKGRSSEYKLDKALFKNVLFLILLTEVSSLFVITNISIRLVQKILIISVYTVLIYKVSKLQKLKNNHSKGSKYGICVVFVICLFVDSIDLIREMITINASNYTLIGIVVNIMIAYLIYAIEYIYLPIKLLGHLTENEPY